MAGSPGGSGFYLISADFFFEVPFGFFILFYSNRKLSVVHTK